MPQTPPSSYQPESPSRRWPWRFISVAVIIIVVGAAALYIFRRTDDTSTDTTNQSIVNTEAPDNLPTTFNQIPDQDRDRLTDNQELELGTNPAAADSDQDQLNDYDEVGIYKTDPKKADTDGDGFSDGYEVDHGFNPMGDGELLDINRALQNQ